MEIIGVLLRDNEQDPSRARELFDQNISIIDIDVTTFNGAEATVSVLPAWRLTSALKIELTHENMELLTEAPPGLPPAIQSGSPSPCQHQHLDGFRSSGCIQYGCISPIQSGCISPDAQR